MLSIDRILYDHSSRNLRIYYETRMFVNYQPIELLNVVGFLAFLAYFSFFFVLFFH